MVNFVELSNKRTNSVRTIEELEVEFLLQTFFSLEVITAWKLQHILHSYKHEAFQKVKYKLDLIEQPYLDKIHSRLTTTVNWL